MNLDPYWTLQQISNLKLQYPDIWDDGDEKFLADCLEAQTDIKEFLAVVTDRILDAKATIKAIAVRIEDLYKRQERYERQELAMRTLAFKILDSAGLKKMVLDEATLSIRPAQPKVIIVNEDELPDNVVRIKREPDKSKIKLICSEGGTVPGAQLSNGEPSLQVRTK